MTDTRPPPDYALYWLLYSSDCADGLRAHVDRIRTRIRAQGYTVALERVLYLDHDLTVVEYPNMSGWQHDAAVAWNLLPRQTRQILVARYLAPLDRFVWVDEVRRVCPEDKGPVLSTMQADREWVAQYGSPETESVAAPVAVESGQMALW